VKPTTKVGSPKAAVKEPRPTLGKKRGGGGPVAPKKAKKNGKTKALPISTKNGLVTNF